MIVLTLFFFYKILYCSSFFLERVVNSLVLLFSWSLIFNHWFIVRVSFILLLFYLIFQRVLKIVFIPFLNGFFLFLLEDFSMHCKILLLILFMIKIKTCNSWVLIYMYLMLNIMLHSYILLIDLWMHVLFSFFLYHIF